MKTIACGFFLAFVLVGCAVMYGSPKVKFSATGEGPGMDKGSNCKVRAYSTPPKEDFSEIGTISFEGWKSNGGYAWGPNSPQEAIDLTRDEVCRQGGDAILLSGANGFGNYKAVTVIKFK